MNIKKKMVAKSGGHNLENINLFDDYIRLSGVDIIPTIYDCEKHYWSITLDIKKNRIFKNRTNVRKGE